MRLRRSPLRSGSASGSSRPHQTVDDSVFLSQQSYSVSQEDAERERERAKRKSFNWRQIIHAWVPLITLVLSFQRAIETRRGDKKRRSGEVNYSVYDFVASRLCTHLTYLRSGAQYVLRFNFHILPWIIERDESGDCPGFMSCVKDFLISFFN